MSRIYKSTTIDPTVTNDDLNAMSKMLAQLGISTVDATGKMRPLNNILLDIQKAEVGMSDSQKMAIDTQGAGVRQANIFAVAINSVGQSQTLANDATNSSGALLAANNKYLDTAAGKWAVLGATVTTMFQQMVDTSAIKTLLDGLTSIVSVGGNLTTIVTILTTAFLLFKQVPLTALFNE